MPTKDKQIAQEAVRKLAFRLYGLAVIDGAAGIEAELHRALDPLLEEIGRQIASRFATTLSLQKEYEKWLK